MKNLLTIIACFFCLNTCLGQQLKSRNNTILDNATERYKVSIDSNNKETIVGDYIAYLGRKVIARGQYANGKRAGVWFFYDANGKESQRYNYDTNKILYEAPEPRYSPMHYRVDYVLNDTDRVIPPFKIGGNFFGYLPYNKLMRRIHELRGLDDMPCSATLIILVSPMGRLANCTVELDCQGNNPLTFVVNTDDLPVEDRQFIPANLNGKEIASRIELKCYPNDRGEITINYDDRSKMNVILSPTN